MSSQEKSRIEKDLGTCATIGDVFHYLSNYFDLFSKDIPTFYRGIIISAILSAISWINPDRKK